jgi:hypothetical protein
MHPRKLSSRMRKIGRCDARSASGPSRCEVDTHPKAKERKWILIVLCVDEFGSKRGKRDQLDAGDFRDGSERRAFEIARAA